METVVQCTMFKSEGTAVVIVTLAVVLGRHGVKASVAYRFSIRKGAFVFLFRSWMAKSFPEDNLSILQRAVELA